MKYYKYLNYMPTLVLLIASGLVLTLVKYVNEDVLSSSFEITEADGTVDTVADSNDFISGDRVEPAISESDTVTVSSNSSENVDKTYDFTNVDASYFDDALFIGDSRTVGLQDYAATINATYYAKVSSTIYKIMDDPMISVNSSDYPYYGSSTISVRQALSRRSFEKIYLMVGINELGTGTPDTYYEQYKSVVEEIRNLQPNAIIFVEAVMHVTTEKSDDDNIYNNKNINERNEKIKTLANGKDIFYIDLNEVFDDETGGLDVDYTFDSVHLKASKYTLWEDFLLSHGILRD